MSENTDFLRAKECLHEDVRGKSVQAARRWLLENFGKVSHQKTSDGVVSVLNGVYIFMKTAEMIRAGLGCHPRVLTCEGEDPEAAIRHLFSESY